jgi:hypothetical protein
MQSRERVGTTGVFCWQFLLSNGQEGLCDKQMRAGDEKELRRDLIQNLLLLKCYK